MVNGIGAVLAACVAAAAVSGCSALGYSNRVLWRVTSPNGQHVAVCQEVPVLDGPNYSVRLEGPDGRLIRPLYGIGDGEPCSEVVWSPDGRTLAVMSGHVARVRFVDVAWALAHPGVQTSSWSWRQVDLSTERNHMVGRGLQFVGPTTVQLSLCRAPAKGSAVVEACESETRRFEIPLPIVTGHSD